MATVKVKVRLVGILRGLAGREEQEVELDKPATVSKLIQSLGASFSQAFRNALIDVILGDQRPNALILVNGTELDLLQGPETELRDGDIVTAIPVAHGG